MTSTTVYAAPLIDAAAAPHAELVRAAARRPLDSPTPCRDWDLHALVNHLLYWTPVLAAAGRREVPAPAVAADGEVDLVTDDWPTALDGARAGLVAAWSVPSAWAGTASMGGPSDLPAEMIGGMILGELVLHGWDLGRAVGLQPEWPAEVLAAALDVVRGMAAQGRDMGVFGPEVTVPANAPTLDRVVALSGRDPGWAH